MKITPKTVRAYSNEANPERCIIRLYKLYLSKLHNDLPPDAFYFKPKEITSPSDPVWFTRQVLGVNTLAKIVSTICTNGGLAGHRTNHSLRATAATRMYDLEFDEQLVCETTGHRSHCVRSYKRTSSELKRKASRAVQGIKRKYQRASQSSQAGASAKSGKQRAAPCATVSMPPQVFNMYFQFGTD